MTATDVTIVDPRTLHGELTEVAYLLPEDLTYEEWAAEVPMVWQMASSAMWWIGDLVRYGERRWGDTYTQAVDVTGLALQTLMNAVWVCNAIPPEERRPSVTFSHHKAIAAIDDPDARRTLLDRAAEEGLTVVQVREHVRALNPAGRAERAPEPVQTDAVEVVCAALAGKVDEPFYVAEQVVKALVDAGYTLRIGNGG